jgi:hypothetical protein
MLIAAFSLGLFLDNLLYTISMIVVLLLLVGFGFLAHHSWMKDRRRGKWGWSLAALSMGGLLVYLLPLNSHVNPAYPLLVGVAEDSEIAWILRVRGDYQTLDLRQRMRKSHSRVTTHLWSVGCPALG